MIIPSLLLCFVSIIAACKRDPVNGMSTGNFSDTSGTLKDAASFPLGIAIDYTPFKNDAVYRSTVAREADNVTFGYQMKHGAIVKDDGSFDYSKADELYNMATTAGLEVFGHTLVWHQNQNGNYLRELTGVTTGPPPPSLLLNGTFEGGSGNNFTNWGAWNGAASITAGAGANEVHEGARSFKATVAASGNPWSVQLASDLFSTTVDASYRVSFWIKAASNGGKIRLSTGTTAQYSSDYNTSTAWTQINWTITARDAETRILFDVGSTANTYYIDDVTVTDASTGVPPTGEQLVALVDTAMSRFIRQSATHYAGKVKAWDVVNEAFDDGGAIRTGTSAGDVFYWGQYLGKGFIKKAFQYAEAADPNALLFINDYGLESNAAKLDSLIKTVEELKAQNVKIDGIGTQMHISWNTSYAGIDEAFRKLAATGLLVRVSELDVRVNPQDKTGFTTTAQTLAYQADMYRYVVSSYLKHIPEAQRHGITIWGVTDVDSWIVVNQQKNDAPLLFNGTYGKKPAYGGVLQALKGQ